MANANILIGHEKEWVALTPDRSVILQAAKTLKELLDKLKGSKEKDTIVTYVLPMDGYYSPLCRL